MKKRHVFMAMLICLLAFGLVNCNKESVANTTCVAEMDIGIGSAMPVMEIEFKANTFEMWDLDKEGNRDELMGSGDFKQSGSTVTMTVDDETVQATVSGDTLTLHSPDDDEDIVFSKK